MKKLGSAIVISGPSGVGKSTVCARVRERLPELGFSVSCTTRKPRPGEVDGVHYHFLSHEEFERRLAAGDFLEYARVFDHIYGTLKSEVIAQLEAGRDVFLDIDVQGAMQIRAAAARDEFLRRTTDFIFIAPPSQAVLEKRLRGRASDSEEQIALRLATSRRELGFWKEYDFLVVNDEFETAVGEIAAIIRSVRLRTGKITEDFLS